MIYYTKTVSLPDDFKVDSLDVDLTLTNIALTNLSAGGPSRALSGAFVWSVLSPAIHKMCSNVGLDGALTPDFTEVLTVRSILECFMTGNTTYDIYTSTTPVPLYTAGPSFNVRDEYFSHEYRADCRLFLRDLVNNRGRSLHILDRLTKYIGIPNKTFTDLTFDENYAVRSLASAIGYERNEYSTLSLTETDEVNEVLTSVLWGF